MPTDDFIELLPLLTQRIAEPAQSTSFSSWPKVLGAGCANFNDGSFKLNAHWERPAKT